MVESPPVVHRIFFEGFDLAQLRAAFLRERDHATTRKSHYFAGRYENICIERARIPEFEPLLNWIVRRAAEVLACEPVLLTIGFWFNAADPGLCTLPHSHDQDDERLAGVYYLQVAPGCGDLLLHDGESCTRISPRAGQLVLFAPAIVHEVTPNHSDGLRLALGFNIGARVDQDHHRMLE